MSKSKVLTIVRSRWVRGMDWRDSCLLSADGKMCCLGFDALACGLPEKAIFLKSTPVGVISSGYSAPKQYLKGRVTEIESLSGHRYREHTLPVLQAMLDNDSPTLSEPEREARIRMHLMKLGWDDVVFVD